jgi:hypothetical protein
VHDTYCDVVRAAKPPPTATTDRLLAPLDTEVEAELTARVPSLLYTAARLGP